MSADLPLVRVGEVDAWGYPVDLVATLDGGQTFRWWVESADALEGFAGPWHVRLVRDPALPPGTVAGEPPEAAGAVRDLLDLGRNYAALDADLVRRDPDLADVVETTRGLRISRVSPWEALLSFLLSSHTHIARIKRMVQAVCQQGEPGPDGMPRPEQLAALGEQHLRSLGLGYRAAYLAATAARLAEQPAWLERGHAMKTPELVEHLMQLPGVGPKVAECVALFGYGRWDAFPVDRWVRRALERRFFGGRPAAPPRLRTFARERWGPLAGLAQAHLFAAARQGARAR
ncbi:MAG: hypothetical protein IMX02_12810 [Limnochordaceae bacterium]|nr:hypothetical protein [Limnochordaceae bacterium]